MLKEKKNVEIMPQKILFIYFINVCNLLSQNVKTAINDYKKKRDEREFLQELRQISNNNVIMCFFMVEENIKFFFPSSIKLKNVLMSFNISACFFFSILISFFTKISRW